VTVSSSPAGEHAGTGPSAPIRHTVDTLNSDALDELYDEIDRLRAKVAEFDHIINWHTTCASCARILDSSYQETMRAEAAEAAIGRVRKATANSFMAGPNAVDVVRVADVLAEPKEG
jgi:hypothetical protein